MKLALVVALLLALLACTAHADRTRLTKERLAWILHTLSRSSVVVNNPGGGSAAIRSQALVNLAMFEAANSIEQKFEPYLVKFSEIPSTVDLRRANKVAAVARAARRVLDWLYKGVTAQGLRFFHREGEEILVQSIEREHPEDIAAGLALGDYIAARLITNRTGDGWVDPPASINVSAVCPCQGDTDYKYNIDPWFPGAPTFSAYGFTVKSFGRADDPFYQSPLYYVPPPPSTDSDANIADMQETFGYGTSYAANQTWTQSTNYTGLFHAGFYGSFNDWSYDVMVTADSIGTDDVDLLRVLAIASMSSHDSHAAHWRWKYTYFRGRPITAYRLLDPNRVGSRIKQFYDPNWWPITVTAQTPEYPSGHSSRTSGFVAVFRLAFGDNHSYSTTSFSLALDPQADTVAKRSYTSFSAMINEVNNARLYAGVHYRSSVNAATVLGTRVASDYWGRLLRPRRC